MCGLLAACALPAFGFDVAELMALLARQGSGQARFSEQRFVKGLDEPLVASGTLSFTAPDRFTRQTLSPRAESMVIAGDTVTLTRGGRSRTLALDASPEALVAVEAIRATLTGNLPALERHFSTRLEGDAQRWMLELKPRDARNAGPLASVQIIGFRTEVRSVETRLVDQDRTVMTIEPVRPAAASASAAR